MVEWPSRGPDGEIDLNLRGVGGQPFAETFWLASCKHFAHSTKGGLSGRAFGADDVVNLYSYIAKK